MSKIRGGVPGPGNRNSFESHERYPTLWSEYEKSTVSSGDGRPTGP